MKLSLDTTNEAVDWVCTLLAGVKYTTDVRVIEYSKHNLDAVSAWAFSIYIYLPYDSHVNAHRIEIENLLFPLQRTGLTTALQMVVVEEIIETEVFTPLPIGRFVILSTDANYHLLSQEEIPLKLKISLAFGTGLHPATMLTLKLLERHIVPKMNVLDLGSGSGILSVAMAKLGAKVLAIDNDIIAVQSTQDAVNRNLVQQVTVMQASLGAGSSLGHWMGGDSINNVPTITPTASFDLIAANILGRIHTTLAPDYQRALRPGGILIASGFTADYEEVIATAFTQKGFELLDCDRFDEWVALAYVKVK